MKKLLLFLILAVFALTAEANVYYDTGLSYTIGGVNPDDGTIYLGSSVNDRINLDYYTVNSPGTHLNLNIGGSIESGAIETSLFMKNNSSATISGGLIGGDFGMRDNTVATISGGLIGGDFFASDDSVATMSGGSVGGELRVRSNSILYLVGSNFSITTDGETTELTNNSHLSDYATPFEPMGAESRYIGTITGTLADGSALDNEFSIYNFGWNQEIGQYEMAGDIIIVPEPATLLIMCSGVLLLRKRRSS